MVKLYDEDMTGYIEVEVKDFYCNDYPNHFARTGKQTYVRWLGEQIYTVPEMVYGSKPTDNGKLILSPDERDELIAKNPTAAKWIRPYVGSREFIHRLPRYCLWLVDCPPNELRRMPLVYQRVQAVRDFRLASKKAATRRDAATPWLFQERRQPTTNYLLVPSVSGERREYVPMDYVSADVICSNANLMVPGAMYWHFGVLTSRPHMAWMRATCGRLGVSYRYSADIVYNNFPWPPFNREVELTAAEILFARSKYPDASFADLYDPLIMPKDLRKAHEANDRAVLEAYDLPPNIPEEQLQKELFKMYKSLRDFDEFYQPL